MALWLSPLLARSTQLSKKRNVILEQEKQPWLRSGHRAGGTLGRVLATRRWVPAGQDRYRYQLRLCRLSRIDEETEVVALGGFDPGLPQEQTGAALRSLGIEMDGAVEGTKQLPLFPLPAPM